MNSAAPAVLEVRNLTKHFAVRRGLLGRPIGTVHAVDDISFSLRAGETLGLVGESGCGKSTAGKMILKLIEPTAGEIYLEGERIDALSRASMRRRRRALQVVFQDPYSSLNPRKSVGQIIAEPFSIHRTEKDVKRRVQDLLARVGLSPEHYNRYPHEFSGGQRQRIGVARAIALQPKLIVCDEPVSALDVSVQAQILNLLEDMKTRYGLTLVFIAHDLAVVKNVSDRIVVMYLGKICEVSNPDALYKQPAHPYTAGLLASIPVPDPNVRPDDKPALAGEIPSPVAPPSGCRFRTRCPKAQDICAAEEPQIQQVAPGQFVACHFPLAPGETLPTRNGQVPA